MAEIGPMWESGIDYVDIRTWTVMPDGYKLYIEDYIYTYDQFTVSYSGNSTVITSEHKRQYEYLMKLFGHKLNKRLKQLALHLFE